MRTVEALRPIKLSIKALFRPYMSPTWPARTRVTGRVSTQSVTQMNRSAVNQLPKTEENFKREQGRTLWETKQSKSKAYGEILSKHTGRKSMMQGE